MMANISIFCLANVLLATESHFNQALLSWCAFGLHVTKSHACCFDFLFAIVRQKVVEDKEEEEENNPKTHHVIASCKCKTAEDIQ